MNQPTPDEQLLEQLVRAAGTRVDPNALAVAATEKRTHGIVRDPEAVLLLRTLARERGRRRRTLWGGAALAAMLVAGLIFAFAQGPRGEAPLAERLETAVAGLRLHDAERFGSFALADDLDATSGVTRTGVAWLAPRGALLAAPARLRWRRPDGVSRVQVKLKGPGVAWERDVDGDDVQAPPLESGRYVVTLRVLGSLTPQTLRRSFVIADAQQRHAYAQAQAVWRAETSADLHDLIEAHYAFSQGFLERALEASRRAEAARGEKRQLVLPLLRYLTR